MKYIHISASCLLALSVKTAYSISIPGLDGGPGIAGGLLGFIQNTIPKVVKPAAPNAVKPQAPPAYEAPIEIQQYAAPPNEYPVESQQYASTSNKYPMESQQYASPPDEYPVESQEYATPAPVPYSSVETYTITSCSQTYLTTATMNDAWNCPAALLCPNGIWIFDGLEYVCQEARIQTTVTLPLTDPSQTITRTPGANREYGAFTLTDDLPWADCPGGEWIFAGYQWICMPHTKTVYTTPGSTETCTPAAIPPVYTTDGAVGYANPSGTYQTEPAPTYHTEPAVTSPAAQYPGAKSGDAAYASLFNEMIA